MHLRALVVGTLLLTSCSWVSKAPKAFIKTLQGTEVSQSGPVASPVSVATNSTTTTAPIPPGSRIVIETPGPGATFQDSAVVPPLLTTTSTTESVIGPTAFTPPADATPAQKADGKLKIIFYAGLVLGSGVALFGLVRGWDFVMYGGLCAAGACAIALFIQAYPWLFAIAGVGLTLSIVGPWLWHTKIKHLNPPPQ